MSNHTLMRTVFRTGALLAALSVILGAFGKHALKDMLSDKQLELFETGVRYQFMHAIGMLLLVALKKHIDDRTLRLSFLLFTTGILIFCGGIYAMSTSEIWSGRYLTWIGAILPLGGLFFISSWLILMIRGYRNSETTQEDSNQ